VAPGDWFIGIESLGMVACLVGRETYRRVLGASVWLLIRSGRGRLIFRHLGHSFRHLVNVANGWF